MGKLMKYELRKTTAIHLLIAALVLVTEGLFLYGLFTHSNEVTIVGGLLLALTMTLAVPVLGFCGIFSFHKDLNTKQSYMMFLLPKNSYELMGSKMIVNFVSIVLMGIAAGAILFTDYKLLCNNVADMKNLTRMLSELVGHTMNLNITGTSLLLMVVNAMESFIMMVSLGFLAVTVTSTVLNGKKFGILVAGALYFLLSGITTKGVRMVAGLATGNVQVIIGILLSLVIAALIFVICGKIMDKKLDV